MNFDFKKMTEPDFEMNGIKFKISKLSPMKGFKLFEQIRFSLVGSAGVAEGGGSEENAALFFKAILALHPDVVQEFMDILFANVQFTGGNVKGGWSGLKGLEDMAFENLEPVHIYEVFGRCLVVNFYGSFLAIASKFPGVGALSQQPKR